ncbi:hypothetical protein [Pontibacter ramchanderi]|uniref:Uncharacterized protein n=1 Tax=Pontibacter ramchanderi TaxID=1179743 RepID=A0A2N3UAI2_9BACT|nr:hypothetical protein [Pontibacter ramchanderi]PKV66410.1 hypothetical protein BD749_1538 [Pontibacter ramchanderi]
MVDFLLSRKTDFYFWTGIAMGLAVTGNFGLGYAAIWYTESFFPFSTVLLLLLTGLLAFGYFQSQSKAESKLEAGCFGGITSMIVLFNAGYSFILVLLLLMA